MSQSRHSRHDDGERLLCSLHQRVRTRRNLIKLTSGEWQCSVRDPCKGGAAAAPTRTQEDRRGRDRSLSRRRSRSRRRTARERGRGRTATSAREETPALHDSDHSAGVWAVPSLPPLPPSLTSLPPLDAEDQDLDEEPWKVQEPLESTEQEEGPPWTAGSSTRNLPTDEAADFEEEAQPLSPPQTPGADDGRADVEETFGTEAGGAPAAKSPSPSRKLCCVVHQRLRTRRNLCRVPGASDSWQCLPKDPCLETGSRRPKPSLAIASVRSRSRSRSRSRRRRRRSDDAAARRPSRRRSDDKAETSHRRRHGTGQSAAKVSAAPALSSRRPVFGAVSGPIGMSPAKPSLPAQMAALKSATELVRCTLHNKLRHPDRMARKANGDWVCTSEDMCKADSIGSAAPASTKASGSLRATLKGRLTHPIRLRLRSSAAEKSVGKTRGTVGSSSSSKASALAGAVGTPATREQRLQALLAAPSRAPLGSLPSGAARGARTSLRPKPGKLARDAQREARDSEKTSRSRRAAEEDPLPEGCKICALHRKPRLLDRLEQRSRGEWVCRPTDRCRNADEVCCDVHKRWRTTGNMEQCGSRWVCKEDCLCR